MYGEDVEGWTRAAHRYLETGRLGRFAEQTTAVRRTFGPAKQRLAKDCARKAGLLQYGVVGPELDKAMRAAGAYDLLADHLLDEYRRKHLLPPLVHPIAGYSSTCQGLHPTAGLAGNWALDFCCRGGTTVVAPERCKVVKLSGRDPSSGAEQTVGIFGWSVHLQTPDFYRYFLTHLGTRALTVGQQLTVGQKIGTVGSWPGNPGRSHLHIGVTSPYGTADARKRILAVGAASRLDGRV